MKYNRQRNQRFDWKESDFTIHYYRSSICVSFNRMTARAASDIGEELVRQLICQRFEVSKDECTDLWISDVDYAILNGFGTEDGFINLVQEVCEARGYKVVYSISL